MPNEELMGDGDRIAAVKYRSIVAIETCIDAGHHIIASEGLRAPSDYADVFAVLAEAGFVPAELAPRLLLMARFRNLLVHEYLAVEDERVAETLRSSLGHLEAFKTSIGRGYGRAGARVDHRSCTNCLDRLLKPFRPCADRTSASWITSAVKGKPAARRRRKATGPRWGPAELPVAGTVRRGPPLAGEAQRFVMSLTSP